MHKFTVVVVIFLLVVGKQQLIAQKNPSFEEIISLESVSNPQLSPDGKHVVFQKRAANWEKNNFDTELWLARDGKNPFQLTQNSKGSSNGAKWSPNGEWITFLSNASGLKQIHVIHANGGAEFQVTKAKKDVGDFAWSPDGQKLAFLQSEDKEDNTKKREKKYGEFAVEDAEFLLDELWIIDFDADLLGYNPLPSELEDSVFKSKFVGEKLIADSTYTITDFQWSPDGKKIAFSHQPDPIINSFLKSDISFYDFTTKEVTTLVKNKSADFFAAWSPDSNRILYETDLDDDESNFYLNSKIYSIALDGSDNQQLAKDFDENLGRFHWNEAGIFAVAWQKTERKLIQINPKNGKASVIDTGVKLFSSYSFAKDGSKLVFIGGNSKDLGEVYLSNYPIESSKKITNVTEQISDWATSNSEVISWKSEDGATIEGMLHKPENYDPQKKYPLMVIVHGGPTGISVPQPVPSYVYPIVQWLNKGALVLQPNYRGSAGYGEKFRSLNVKNLGVGDAWDVLSGVAYLEKEGLIDQEKMGVMGWSQGGYISAFLATNSDQFKAISVGAGISNWVTYYVNTDIHPFTRQYLKSTPWEDMAVYEKTSPMTNIKNASTPTLIQHGEFDKRVPPANAFELYQGLQDVGVTSKLIIYKGFGHGITKPKERLVAMWHNWQWFGKYVWDEEIEIPE